MHDYISIPRFLFLFILSLIYISNLHARVIHVPDDSTTIQAAIEGASNGDTVLVAPGTYNEFAIGFRGKAIRVTSQDPLDSLVVESTVVEGNNRGVVFFFRDNEDSSSVLDGFTITGGSGDFGAGINCQGSAPLITHNHIRGNNSTLNGGGIYASDSSPIVRDNLIDSNTAPNAGGGVYLTNSSGELSNNTISGNSTDDYGGGIVCDNSDPLISNNRITGNSTVELSGGIHCSYSSPVITNNYIEGNTTGVFGSGGGIYCYESSPDITGNIISSNWAGERGGGIYSFHYSNPLISDNVITENSANYVGGGGICTYDCSPTITDNTITGNSADDASGGGILCYNYSPVIRNNAIVGNTTDHWGGGIFCWNTISPVIENNILKRNSAVQVGGGISCYQSTVPNMDNNTIYLNSAGDGGGAISCSHSSFVTVKNSILWDNEAPVGPEIYIYDDPDTLNISHSNVKGGEGAVEVDPGCALNWGDGMIDTDPLFFDEEARLELLSPCVDAGDPADGDNCRPPGRGTGRSDMGAHGGDGNCWSPELGINLMFYLPNPLAVEPGSRFDFGTMVLNNSQSGANGDYWFSVILPDQNELIIPANFSNYLNPLTGNVPPFSSTFLYQRITVPAQADTGSYTMVGRIGLFPSYELDKETFGFQIIE